MIPVITFCKLVAAGVIQTVWVLLLAAATWLTLLLDRWIAAGQEDGR